VPDRRTFLTGLAGAGVAASLAGCAGSFGVGRTVTVAVTWSGAELNAFRKVLRGLETRHYQAVPIPYGDDIDTALGSSRSRRPDVVMLPQPGLVAKNRDSLAPLPDGIWRSPEAQYDKVWESLLFHDGQPYGVPFKITHKSVVWYRKSVFGKHGLTPPTKWTEWLELNRRLVRCGETPLALGAADGWMLTDFFENVLVGCSPGSYKALTDRNRPRLADDPMVGKALRLLGRMWAEPDALAGGVNGSLVQQFTDAVVEVFGHGRAAMVVAPDFAEVEVLRFAADPGDIRVFPFPAVDGDDQDSVPASAGRPLIVGGDVAVLSADPTEDARDLVSRLAGPSAPLPWIRKAGGFLAAHRDTPTGDYSNELRKLNCDITKPPGEIQFDLSDQLGPIGGRTGLWRVLQDFLVRVGGQGSGGVPHEVDEAMKQLRELEG